MKRLFREDFPFSPARWPFFYGYVITVCAVIGLLLSVPGQTIGISVFTDDLIAHLKLSRLQLSMAYTVGTIISSLLINRVGKLLDKFGPRMIATIAAFSLGIVLLVLSQIDRLLFAGASFLGISRPIFFIFPFITLCFLCIRFFGQGILSLSSRTMLMKWFVDLRGRINSIMGVFVTLGFSGAPLVFEKMMHHYGWRGAWVVMGLALIGCFSGVIWFFFRNTPEASGLVPDGRVSQNHQQRVKEEQTWTLKEARKTYTFWVFNLSLAMFSLFITAVTFHIVSIYDVVGLERSTAVSVFLPSSVMAVLLNLVAGWLSDWKITKYRLKYLFMAMLTGLIALGIGVLGLKAGWGRPVMILGLGLSQGLFSTLVAVAWPRYFGRGNLGAIAGYNMSFLVFFSAIGPSIFGWSFQVTGNYVTGVLVCCVVLGSLVLASFKADRPEFEET